MLKFDLPVIQSGNPIALRSVSVYDITTATDDTCKCVQSETNKLGEDNQQDGIELNLDKEAKLLEPDNLIVINNKLVEKTEHQPISAVNPSQVANDRRRSPLRLRTLSIPELGQQNRDKQSDISGNRRMTSAGGTCKRHLSVTQSDRMGRGETWRRPLIHDEEWYRKTQQLFLALKNSRMGETSGDQSLLANVGQAGVGKSENCHKKSNKYKRRNLQYSSSRLTSHHSSSDEEWYTEIQEKLAMVEDKLSEQRSSTGSCAIKPEHEPQALVSPMLLEQQTLYNSWESTEPNSERSMKKDFGTELDIKLSNPPPTRTTTMVEQDLYKETIIGAIRSLKRQQKISLSSDEEEEAETNKNDSRYQYRTRKQELENPEQNPQQIDSLEVLLIIKEKVDDDSGTDKTNDTSQDPTPFIINESELHSISLTPKVSNADLQVNHQQQSSTQQDKQDETRTATSPPAASQDDKQSQPKGKKSGSTSSLNQSATSGRKERSCPKICTITYCLTLFLIKIV